MIPGLGDKYDIKIEVTSKAIAEYLTDEYFALDLPVAPAIMVGDEIIVEGTDVDDHVAEVAICKSLGLEEPALPNKKGVIGRLFNR